MEELAMVDFKERWDDSDRDLPDNDGGYRVLECRVQAIGALLPQVLARYLPPTIVLPLGAGTTVQSVANPAMTA